ncbi:SGNH/GDSL hydrolase family protein [Kitasatospora sp. NBC_00240]|uniref:GDSL-type esterase/lipase family protein n=1 Tax=Kitasatospora sp. NBC_00240 TaxID=2903567 RepID=UPI0022507B61|nr:SGNH/GDSL hydrolase family protein [Kitasatospora sp. NBC_00240]MCX5211613.1 SGNH/GDSL hydrolase family protein [Kitasatospora sp. NBC_00240]
MQPTHPNAPHAPQALLPPTSTDPRAEGRPTTGTAPTPSAEQTARLVRFRQPAPAAPGEPDDAREAARFGLDPAAHRELLLGFEEQVRQAAAELLADTGFADLVARLPFRPGEHIVALGESTTADRLSWFEILRRLLPPGVRLSSLAVPGCTTTQALAQLPALALLRPDRVLCMLGANDVQRLGPDAVSLVGADETRRNLLLLRELAGRRTSARWIWLTPTGVHAERVAAYPHFRRAGIGWANEDIDALAAFLLSRPEPTVDTRPATTTADDGTDRADDPHQPDGLHLTLAGQRSVVAALVRRLAEPA